MHKSSCPHVITIGDWSPEDMADKAARSRCETCGEREAGLWCCLHRDCGYVGCGEKRSDHSAAHFSNNQEHSLMINLKSNRIWCHTCETEVFLANNVPAPGRSPLHPDVAESEIFSDDIIQRPLGLAGLQNLGNTCYMNAALQALSNCPQLTHYFLNTPIMPQHARADHRRAQTANLALSYCKMIQQMWHEKRPPYVVPSGVAYGIKSVCPVFRGATQQDAQEFLRCFLDQLHDELKREYVPKKEESLDEASLLSQHSDQQQSHSQRGEQPQHHNHLLEDEMDEAGDIRSVVGHGDAELRHADEDDEAGDDDDHAAADEDEEMPSSFGEAGVSTANGGCKQSLHRGAGCGQQENADDDFETCDSGLSSEKSEASASDKNTVTDTQRTFQIYNLLIGEFQKSKAFAGLKAATTAAGGSAEAKKPATSYRSIISDVFDGRLLSSVQCFTCETVSSTKEVFQDLSLPIPSRDHLERLHHAPSHHTGDLSSASSSSSLNSLAAAQAQQQSINQQQGWIEWLFKWLWSWVWGPTVSLTDCLAAFFSADELKGDNMYSCGKCNKLRNGIKYSKLLELPEVLCVHLKRFRHELLFSTKISNRVSFPLEGLDMGPFTHPHARDEVTSYDLIAVICHHGTASSGHYTSYAKNEYDGNWYEYDDVYVGRVDPSVVAACEAYVLFYRKSSEEMVKRRHHAADLIERSRCEQLDDTTPTFYISRRWVNRFNTFAEPGPIDNEEFACPHGGLNPMVADDDLVLFSQSVWEYLLETFKGGPAITSPERCSFCLDIQRILLGRRFGLPAAVNSATINPVQLQQEAPERSLEAVVLAGGDNLVRDCRLKSLHSEDHVAIVNDMSQQALISGESVPNEEHTPMETDDVAPGVNYIGEQQQHHTPQQDSQTHVTAHGEQDNFEDVLAVERPDRLAIDNLLDNVVLKMTSARVTDVSACSTGPTAPEAVSLTLPAEYPESENAKEVNTADEDLTEADSAFCSPMDSVASRDFPSTNVELLSPSSDEQTTCDESKTATSTCREPLAKNDVISTLVLPSTTHQTVDGHQTCQRPPPRRRKSRFRPNRSRL